MVSLGISSIDIVGWINPTTRMDSLYLYLDQTMVYVVSQTVFDGINRPLCLFLLCGDTWGLKGNDIPTEPRHCYIID